MSILKDLAQRWRYFAIAFGITEAVIFAVLLIGKLGG